LDGAADRRRELELEVRAAREVERSARQSLDALEVVARDAGVDLPERDEAGDTGAGLTPLSGAALREMLARVALRSGAVGEARHWREWLGQLRQHGYDAAGKSPEATFQTQLARSALMVRTDQDGVYRLELGRVAAVRERLSRQHDELSRLPPTGQLALIGDVRAQRQELQNEIARGERALEEMWRVLVQERPPGWLDEDEDEPEPERLVDAWLSA
jgi:hypothetical protein